jgi:hypothetical protein
MKKSFLFVLGLVMIQLCVFSQNDTLLVQKIDTVKKHKIAIFAPLYLDSAFDAKNEYRYTKNVFPKFINPGLEFYEGVQLALDSLSREKAELEVFIYDTRSGKQSLEQQLARPELADVELIIANCSTNEVRPFAEFAQAKNIPFVNATVPNDVGISSNPFFIILNPTLKTQCEGIYRYIQKYYSLEPLIVFRKRGSSDDMIKTILDDYSKATMSVPLKMKYVTLADSFTVNDLKAHLDSNRRSVCVSGSLDINFGRRLIQHLASIGKSYPITVIGMPTWEAMSRDFSRPELKGIEIVYSTPFYNSKTSPVSVSITNYFNNEMYARPTDMVFRGYEVTWKYAKLLMQYGKDISSNLANKQHHVFTEYDIQPVINRNTTTLEYFENKKLYFMKWVDGLIKVAN